MSKENNPEFTCISCERPFMLIGQHYINKRSRMWCPYCGKILVVVDAWEDSNDE